MDYSIITSVLNYFPIYKKNELAKGLKNQRLSKTLFEKVHLTNTFIVYPKIEETAKIISLPSKKNQDIMLRGHDLSGMSCRVITNFIFFFHENLNVIHVFILNPFHYKELNIGQPIKEIYFYFTSFNRFYIILNNEEILDVDKLEISRKFNLSQGFFYQPLLLDGKLYSDISGNEIIIQDLSEYPPLQSQKNQQNLLVQQDIESSQKLLLHEEPQHHQQQQQQQQQQQPLQHEDQNLQAPRALGNSLDISISINDEAAIIEKNPQGTFKTEFQGSIHYLVLGAHHLLIDLSTYIHIEKFIPYNTSLNKKEYKNALFKIHLNEPNEIKLEFLFSLPDDLSFERFDIKETSYFAKSPKENSLVLMNKDKLIGKVSINNLNKSYSVMQIDYIRLAVQFDETLLIIDFYYAKVVQKANLMEHLGKALYFNHEDYFNNEAKSIISSNSLESQSLFVGELKSSGEFYQIALCYQVKNIKEWRYFILNQSFNLVYEMNNSKYFVVTDYE